jgi:hypothetical protein
MNDPRFDRAYPAAQAFEERRSLEVRALLAQVGAMSEIEAALRGALALSEPEASARRFAELTAPLSSGPDTQMLDALTKALADERSDEPWMRAARYFIGRVFGALIAERPPSADTFDAVGQRAERTADWRTFADAFAARASELGMREAWLAELAQPLPPSEYLVEYRRAQTEALPPPVSVEQVWRDRWVSVPFGAKAAYRFSVLARWGGQSFAHAISALPNVPVQRAALEHVGTRDRDFLLDALRAARPVFEDGQFRNAAGLLLAEAYVAHASNLSQVMELGVRDKNVTPEELKRLREQEIPAWFQALATATIERTDGIRVMLELGGEFARRAALPAGTARKAWAADEIALATFAEKTMALQPAWRALQDAVETSRGFGFLMLAAYAAGQSAGTAEARRWVWDRYVDALIRNDPALESHVNPFGGAEQWVFLVFALALRAQASFDEAWQKTWRLPTLEGQRARARFGRRNDASASVHLIRVGYAVLAITPDETESRRRLWELVFQAAVMLMVSEQSALLSWSYRDAAMAFAHVPHLFGDQWRGVLDRHALLLQADARLVLNAAALLTMNGLPRTEVVEAFTRLGVDPLAAGRELVEWDGDRAGPGETNARDLLAQLAPPDAGVPSTS